MDGRDTRNSPSASKPDHDSVGGSAKEPFAEANMSLRNCGVVGIGVVASVAMLAIGIAPASAEKSGGTLRIYNSTQPPSASIHEESTIATNISVLPSPPP